MEEAVRAGRFREDLFYRVNVIQIDLPPLRERLEDIEELSEKASGVLQPGTTESPVSPTRRSPRSRGYAWPGNVRELRNVIERAAILCQGKLIDPPSCRPCG